MASSGFDLCIHCDQELRLCGCADGCHICDADISSPNPQSECRLCKEAFCEDCFVEDEDICIRCMSVFSRLEIQEAFRESLEVY